MNGWNSVVDNNAGKSIISIFNYKIPDRLQLQLLYMGGPERTAGTPEGQPWRHLADAFVQFDANSVISLLAEADAGLERNQLGTSTWGAAAIYARLHPVSWLYLAARGDRLQEHRGAGASGTASPIFFPGIVGVLGHVHRRRETTRQRVGAAGSTGTIRRRATSISRAT